jgi:mono/diheme cytochrome c family protein
MLRMLILLTLFVPGVAAAQTMRHDKEDRGEYLARVGDCVSCHTAPGKPNYGGGLAINSPFGAIYSTNITPDKQYGIGAYTLDDFKRAVRRGVAKDGHHLYPAMPYVSFSAVSDADMAALYDYFEHQVAPVHVKPPQTQLPFPLNQRWGMMLWNLFFAAKTTPKPSPDARWARGAYLVQTLGHCGACHTPRGIAYNERGTTSASATYLSGGTLDNWHAPNLRGDSDTGLGRWSEGDIAAFLGTGHGANVAAFGSMTQVVENSSQFMSDADRLAIAHYLKSLPPQGKAPPMPAPVPGRERPGAGIYASACARCHGLDARGSEKAPALAGNPAVVSADGTSVTRIILKGGRTAKITGGPPPQFMPGFEPLSDREIAEVATYVRQDFGANAPAVTPGNVARLRKALKGQPVQSVPSINGAKQ